MNYLKYIYVAIISLLVLFGGIYVGENLMPKATGINYGATGSSTFSPVQCAQTTLSGSGINNSQTTIPLTSFTTPGGLPLTMANFGSIGYVVADPNSPTKIENMTFTGIQQNANGTAVLTGVTRGIDFVAPYAASTTLAVSHSGGAYLICSNPAAFYGQQFLFANQAGTSTATIVFSSTTPPVYDFDPIWANFSTQALADVAYVNSVVAAGAANASETVKGIIQLATASQAALGTSLGSTGARLALGNNLATSTPYNGGTNVVPVTGTNEKLSQLFLDLTQAFSWSGIQTYSASSTFNATTTIAASSTVANALRLNGVNYAFPSGISASSTFLSTDANGNLTWEPLVSSSTINFGQAISGGTSGTTTLATYTLAPNTLTTRKMLNIWMLVSTTGGSCSAGEIDFGNGSATTSTSYFGMSTSGNPPQLGTSNTTIMATSSSAEITNGIGYTDNQGSSGQNVGVLIKNASFSLASTLYIGFSVNSTNCILNGYSVTVTNG